MTGRILVKCGAVNAWLHAEKFLCPGIHAECIEVQDGSFVTPKTFSVMGEKEKLKDWKNAIRINGMSVRKMMDTGRLEFYDHKTTCTGKCVSRNAGISKYDTSGLTGDKADIDLGTYVPALNQGINQDGYSVIRDLSESDDSSPLYPSPAKMSSSSLTVDSILSRISKNGYPPGSVFPQVTPVKREPEEPTSSVESPTVSSPVPIKKRRKIAAGQHAPLKLADIKAAENSFNADEVMEDAGDFWQGIMDVRLLDEFFREIKTALDVLKCDLIRQKRFAEDSANISSIVMKLGLMTKLKWKLALHKTETEKQKKQLNMEMEAVRKKMADTERKQQVLKKKVNSLDHLMGMGRPSPSVTSSSSSASPPLDLSESVDENGALNMTTNNKSNAV